MVPLYVYPLMSHVWPTATIHKIPPRWRRWYTSWAEILWSQSLGWGTVSSRLCGYMSLSKGRLFLSTTLPPPPSTPAHHHHHHNHQYHQYITRSPPTLTHIKQLHQIQLIHLTTPSTTNIYHNGRPEMDPQRVLPPNLHIHLCPSKHPRYLPLCFI
jgi:hypothetical protein